MSELANMTDEELAAELQRRRYVAQAEAEAEEAVQTGIETARAERMAAAARSPATLSPEDEARVAALRDLEERGHKALDEEFAPAWLPWKEGSEHPHELAAVLVTKIDPDVGPSPTFGTYSAVIGVIDTEGRRWSLWANKPDSALWHQLLRLKLQVGDVIAARFNGKRPSKDDSNRTVNDVRLVRVDDAEEPQPIDYDALSHAHEPTPELAVGAAVDDGIPFLCLGARENRAARSAVAATGSA